MRISFLSTRFLTPFVFFLSFIGVAFVFDLLVRDSASPSPAYAQTITGTFTGYAWSSNVGWISMSGGTGATAYGVTIGADNTTLSGYAWSQFAGWISFNSNTCSGVAASPTYNSSTKALSGWAKALNGINDDGCISLSGVSSGSSGSPTTIFLISGSSWTVPADWNNSNNSIEVIGGGGGGNNGASGSSAGGGGGGAYSKITNVSLSGSVAYVIGSGGTPGVTGGDTWFNGATCAGSSVCAKGGQGATGAGTVLGGQAANGVGSITYSGGGTTSGGGGGKGGGGAAGPNGNGGDGGAGYSSGAGGGGGGNGGGVDGQNGQTPSTGGTGGNNSSGTGGGAAAVSSSGNGSAGTNGGGGGGGGSAGTGGAGGNGIEWNATHGSGGGGGGGRGSAKVGGAGGLYGGGGAGGANLATAGTGGQGIVVITYTPGSSGTYGAVINNTTPTSSYAWASDVFGWIDFKYVKVSANPPSCTLTAPDPSNPANWVVPGQVFTMSWTSTNAASGTIDRSVGSISPIASGNKNWSESTPSYPGDFDYTLTVQNIGGETTTCTASVEVVQDQCTNPDSSFPGIQATVPTHASQSGFTCTCDSANNWVPNGAGACTLAVPVLNNFYPSQIRVRSGVSTSLNWKITYMPVEGCQITSAPNTDTFTPGYTTTSASSSIQTDPITQTTDFTLDCGSGVTPAKKTVTVIPSIQEI
jgi:hypothetical protein